MGVGLGIACYTHLGLGLQVVLRKGGGSSLYVCGASSRPLDLFLYCTFDHFASSPTLSALSQISNYTK